MKKTILMLVMALNSFNLFSQESVHYVILTSQQRKGDYITEDGIYRSTTKDSTNRVRKSPAIFFIIKSPDRKIEEMFYHAIYDFEKLIAYRDKGKNDPNSKIIRPDEMMDVKIMPISFLNSINPIDLDKEFPTMTYESAKERLEPLRGQKIYIIDRNDITEKTIKLIGVQYKTVRPMSFPIIDLRNPQ